MAKRQREARPKGRPPIAGRARLEKVTLRLHADEVAALKQHARLNGQPYTRFAVSVLENSGVLKRPAQRRSKR